MIRLSEMQLVALLNIAKKNSDIDVYELLTASGIKRERENAPADIDYIIKSIQRSFDKEDTTIERK